MKPDLDRALDCRSGAVVVVPVYNEVVNVENLIGRLLTLESAVDVLFVDDNSPDGTAQIVEAHPQFMPVSFC
jgi:dolichol-phosphate mannosyltransferase